MQKGIVIFMMKYFSSPAKAVILLIFMVACSPASAQTKSMVSPGDSGTNLALADLSAEVLAQADSLFAARQYTQAAELYQTVFRDHHYSPAMLLKMAYIHEGLGHLGESLYYLNLYHLASNDLQALKKMEELAEKNQLEGYESDASTKIFGWLQQHYLPLTAILASLNILLLALLIQNRRKRLAGPGGILFVLTLTLTLLFLQVNFTHKTRRGIVTHAPTYLMSGPSAGSSVVAIIGEGHQLHIQGQQDIWLKVEWKEKEVFVRDFLVRGVAL